MEHLKGMDAGPSVTVTETYFLVGILLKLASMRQSRPLAVHREQDAGNFPPESHFNCHGQC